MLSDRFPAVKLERDVTVLPALPDDVEVVTAGFPCTDSVPGRTNHRHSRGPESGLISHVFRLLDMHQPRWLVLENVRNMLHLDAGQAMRYLVTELERRQYSRWASPEQWTLDSLGYLNGGRGYCLSQAKPRIHGQSCFLMMQVRLTLSST